MKTFGNLTYQQNLHCAQNKKNASHTVEILKTKKDPELRKQTSQKKLFFGVWYIKFSKGGIHQNPLVTPCMSDTFNSPSGI